MAAKRLVLIVVSMVATGGCSHPQQTAASGEPAEAAALAPASGSVETDSYFGRNGEAEALADLARGKPVKLYSYEWEGEVPRYVTPGLLNCDPDLNDDPVAANAVFSPLPEENGSEGNPHTHTEEHEKRAASARRFAKAYNLTMFHRRSEQILRMCPSASQEE